MRADSLEAKDGAGGQTRTADLLITNQLLCQLSYTGAADGKYTEVSLAGAMFQTFDIVNWSTPEVVNRPAIQAAVAML